MLLGPVGDLGEVGAEGLRDDVVAVADEDRPVADPGEPGDVLDHLGVVVGGEVRLVVAAVGHGDEADEVGQPDVGSPLQLRVLVPEVVDVPRLVADDQVVATVLDHLLEHHEVGDQDLVHATERLEAVQLVAGGLRGDVSRLVGQPLAGGVDRSRPPAARTRGDRVLGEPVDLHVGLPSLQLLHDRQVAAGVTQPDR